MLFNSLDYYCLLAITVMLYWMSQRVRLRQAILLASSLFFYAYFDLRLLPVLFYSIGVTFVFSQLGKRNPLFFSLSILLNLLLLGFFKYTNFIATNVLSVLGLEPSAEFSIALPLGISFFVFQAVSYTVDIRRGVAQPEKNLPTFSLFISFFPQLIAGPICRSSDLMMQLQTLQPWRSAAFAQGALMLGIGLLMKTGFADNLAPLVETVFGEDASKNTVAGVLAFSLQILYDFWGYSTMALGAAWMFGIMLPVNFNLPYVAVSVREFWRRWHITLSFWLRDYLYVALGGNRGGTSRTGANLMLVMLIGGLWHGAAWTFVVWGAIHGLALLIERFTLKVASGVRLPRTLDLARRLLQWCITMYVVLIAWVFFRAPSLDRAIQILSEFVIETGTILTARSIPDFGDYAIYFWASILFMLPFHWLISMGGNMMFYGRDLASASHIGVPPSPSLCLSGPGFSVTLSNIAKVALGFWFTVVAIVLTAPDSVPFIYFQF